MKTASISRFQWSKKRIASLTDYGFIVNPEN